MGVADGDVFDCAGGGRFGEHSCKLRPGGGHGLEIALVIQVHGTLQRLGELPVAWVVVLEFADQGGYGFQIHVVGEHVFVEDGDVHTTQCVWEVTGAGGLFAEFGG